MTEAFYRKYRPRLLSELEHTPAREVLKKIVAHSEIPHAFLFAGPKGIGKTSAARILAKILGCFERKGIDPCNKCEVCQATDRGVNLDIIEIDAASNRGIDDIREIRDKVNLRPMKAKSKVYIIDEVHMLTQEAFNGILKTLEEPPDHVYFIFCTTNQEKIPETVLSRLTVVNFSRATDEEVMISLNRIVKSEGIQIDLQSLRLITQSADGSFRDAHKILYQLYLAEGKKISREAVKKLIGKWLMFSPRKLVAMILLGKQKQALKITQELEKEGIDFQDYLKRCLEWVQQLIFFKVGASEKKLVEPEGYINNLSLDLLVQFSEKISQALLEQKTTPIVALPLQLLIASWPGQELPVNGAKKDFSSEVEGVEGKNQDQSVKKQDKPIALASEKSDLNLGLIKEKWSDVLRAIKPMNHSVEALLRACRPLKLEGNRLVVEVFYRFHKEKLEEERNRQIVEAGLENVFGIRWQVFCILAEKKPAKQKEEVKDEEQPAGVDDELFEMAKEIFGN